MNLREKIISIYDKYIVLIGIGGHFMFVLQTYKLWVSKSAEDLSLEGFIVSFFSLVSWLIYGLLKKDLPLIIVNIFGAVASLVCIISILILR